MNEKTAIILAAGRGSRLRELTDDQPKPMVPVNGKSIISNLVENLIASGFQRIVILVGYKAELLKVHLQPYSSKTEMIFIENKVFATTNNIYTLWLAKEYLHGGFFLFEADIFCEKSILKQLADSPAGNIIVADQYTRRMSGTVIKFDKNTHQVKGMYLGKNQTADFDYSDAYKTVNFYKFSRQYVRDYFLQRLKYHIDQNHTDAYYELIVLESLNQNFEFRCMPTGDGKWWEIDNEEDLEIARQMFA